MPRTHCSRFRAAFTLLEVAMVIIIIALLVGTITVSQSMKHNSEIQKVLSTAQGFASSIQQFKAKYNALPGDMIDATRVWGEADPDCNVIATANARSGVGVATCNGDGDGFIRDGNGGTLTESFRVWEHLALAGFIGGQYTGIQAVAGAANFASTVIAEDDPLRNAPGSPIKNAGFYIGSYGNITDTAHASNFVADYNNAMIFGTAAAGNIPNGPVFKPTDAFMVDQKLDDGSPAYGQIVTYKNVANCVVNVTNTAIQTAAYGLTFTNAACMLFFLNKFQAKPE